MNGPWGFYVVFFFLFLLFGFPVCVTVQELWSGNVFLCHSCAVSWVGPPQGPEDEAQSSRPRVEPSFCSVAFSRLSDARDLDIGTVVATLPDSWH